VSYRPLLDRVRWLSATIVAAGHGIAILNDQVHGSQVLNVLAQMRNPAVIVFFVLSGYLVGGSVLKDFASFQLRRYLIARFARIYIVLIPALLLTLLIDGAVYHFDRLNPLFSQAWQGGALGDTPIFLRYDIARAVASVLCLEPLLAGPIGSAGSLWSLGNEWIYYFAFPALFAIGFRFGGFRTATVLAFASAIPVALVSRMGAAFWLVWLGGAYASAVDLRRLLRWEPLVQISRYAAYAVGILALALSAWLGMRICTAAIGIAGFVVLSCRPATAHVQVRRIDQGLARFSYSLYVTHLQVMTLLAAILFRCGLLPRTGIVSPVMVIALALGMLVISIGVARGFATLFEDRTPGLAQWLNRQFGTPVAMQPGLRQSS
jgi:peptidoglycan/LPS O-acetylase OafA/YrhL